jgi:glutamate 5-kinase
MAGCATSAVGTGGMKTKIEAAEKATSHGITTFILNGFKEETFNRLLAGEPRYYLHTIRKTNARSSALDDSHR